MSYYCVCANFYVKPDRREDFIAALRVDAEGTRKDEQGNILFTWGESTTEPNTFHVQEQYENEEAFKAHLEAPHCKAFLAIMEIDPFTKPLEFWSYVSMQ
eukprot:CAMPEP_0182423642 /NCGR_PEP_ID=MMETSP1167-20130531/9717_1 /TAXON_ID=2988 /ORGANISM="Mallomonas Sp, Strain CCMP3275" /LENGTH=99 /DNA_ID=CAMNT_0024602817 /DNA_START=33 /DNA_END=332 /DNA_ORIENTATION=-